MYDVLAARHSFATSSYLAESCSGAYRSPRTEIKAKAKELKSTAAIHLATARKRIEAQLMGEAELMGEGVMNNEVETRSME